LVAQSGITNFVEWFSAGLESKDHVGDIFSSAPRELARALTLQQTAELVRTSMAVVEEMVEQIAGTTNTVSRICANHYCVTQVRLHLLLPSFMPELQKIVGLGMPAYKTWCLMRFWPAVLMMR
jgi:hypothetical protein